MLLENNCLEVDIMELINIKTNKCPICGCTDIISESVEVDIFNKIKTHCNGTRWEKFWQY